MRSKSSWTIVAVLLNGLLMVPALAQDKEASGPDDDYSIQEEQATKLHPKAIPALKAKQDDQDGEVADEDLWNSQRKSIGDWASGWSTEDDETWHRGAPKDWPAEWKDGWGNGWTKGWGAGWGQGWGDGQANKKQKPAKPPKDKPAK